MEEKLWHLRNRGQVIQVMGNALKGENTGGQKVTSEVERIAKLVNKCSYSKNQSMVEVYESIKQGSCTEEQVRWRDSLGISALYYAIAMHNDDAIRSCISIRNAHTLQWYHDNIDYCTAAKYAKLNEDIIKDIFMAKDI